MGLTVGQLGRRHRHHQLDRNHGSNYGAVANMTATGPSNRSGTKGMRSPCHPPAGVRGGKSGGRSSSRLLLTTVNKDDAGCMAF